MNNNDIRKYFKELFESIFPLFMCEIICQLKSKLSARTFRSGLIDKKNNFNFIKSKFWEIRTENSGIVSLSENDSNTLMWGHYSTENGFLIEFNTEKLIRKILFLNKKIRNYVFMPIQYVENIETIDFFSEEFHSADIPYLYALNIKKADWKYENEWRLVCYSEGFGIPFKIRIPEIGKKGIIDRHVYYDDKAVNSIVLGQHFFCGKNVVDILGNNVYAIDDKTDGTTNLDFVNFLYSNYNDRIYIFDNFDTNENFIRKKVKIRFDKVNDKTFKVVRE